MRTPIPESDLLKTFLAVVECGSLTQAGRRVYMTVPAVKNHIDRLEQQRGKVLFQRGRFGMRLTDDGRELLMEHRRT